MNSFMGQAMTGGILEAVDRLRPVADQAGRTVRDAVHGPSYDPG